MKRHIYKQFVDLKKKLGRINYWNIEAENFPKAHYKLGEKMRSQTLTSLKQKLIRVGRDRLQKELVFAEKCRRHLENKIQSKKISQQMKLILKEYIDCFKAWCQGIGIDEKIGYWLQNENITCQTGLIRVSKSAIVAWHTEEEDPKEAQIKEPTIANFHVANQTLTTFIHPFYMPGTGFSWQRNFFQAVNSFYLKYKDPQGGAFASIFSWLIWRLGEKAHFESIIQSLQPFIDGYSVLYVKKTDDQNIQGGIIEFGGHNYTIKLLSDKLHDYLFLATVIGRDSSLLKYQTITKRTKQKYMNRLKRTKELLDKNISSKRNITISDVLEMLTSRWGNSFAYCNKDVKAHVVAEISRDQMKIIVGPGPALRDEHYNVIRIE